MAAAEVNETEMVKPVNKQEQVGNMAVAVALHQTESVRQKVKGSADSKKRNQIIKEFTTTTGTDGKEVIDEGKDALYSAARIAEIAAKGPSEPGEQRQLDLPPSLSLQLVVDNDTFRYAVAEDTNVITVTRVDDLFAQTDNGEAVVLSGLRSDNQPQSFQMSRTEFVHLTAAHPNVLRALSDSDLSSEEQKVVELNAAKARGETVQLPTEVDGLLEKAADRTGLVSRERMKKVLEHMVPASTPNREQDIDNKIAELFADKPFVDPMELRPLLRDLSSGTVTRTKEQIQQSVSELKTKAKSLKELADMAATLGSDSAEYKQAIQDLRDTLTTMRSQQDELNNYDAVQSLSSLFESIDNGKIAKSAISILLGAIASGSETDIAETFRSLEMSEEEQRKFRKRLQELGPQILKIGGPLLLMLILSAATEGLKKGTK